MPIIHLRLYALSYLVRIPGMAAFACNALIVHGSAEVRAIASARRHQEMLFYCQAVDESGCLGGSKDCSNLLKDMVSEPNVKTTGGLPGVVMFHKGMRVRLTKTVQAPWAVQDASGVIEEIHFSNAVSYTHLTLPTKRIV